jgi:hypothetical protein
VQIESSQLKEFSINKAKDMDRESLAKEEEGKKNMFTLKHSDSMNTLFYTMLKQYREKRQIISA